MIPGTLNFLSKSGTVALRIITKMLQKIQENYGLILEKYYLCQSWTHKISKHSQVWTHQTPIFLDFVCPHPQKKLVSPSVFKAFFGGGILVF